MSKRLGIYIFNGAEVIDWAGPYGVFAVARRLDPELEVFLVGESHHAPHFVDTVAHTMEYEKQWALMKNDRLIIPAA